MSAGRFLLVVGLTLLTVPALAGFKETRQAIQEELSRGGITSSEAALYKLYAHKSPEKLPQRFNGFSKQRASALPGEDRCATAEMMGIRRELKHLPPALLKDAAEALGESPSPGTSSANAFQKTFGLVSSGKTVTHTLTSWLESPNFSIEWGKNLTNEDGTLPLRDDNQNSIPDVAELWASYFEYAYAATLAMGFEERNTLATHKIQVFIAGSDPTTNIDNMPSSYYGETDGDVPHVDGTPPAYIIVSDDFAYIVANVPNFESFIDAEHGMRGAMMVTAAHELNHVFQFYYSPAYMDTTTGYDENSWWFEATSTWAEDQIFPYVNDYWQYFEDQYGWQNFPEMTLAVNTNRAFANSTIRKCRTYGAAIFGKYLSEHMGGAETVVTVWDNMSQGDTFVSAVGSAADSATGAATGTYSMADVFLGFAGANATMDYDDGFLYGAVPRRSTEKPEIWGSSLLDYIPSTDGTVSFSLTGLNPDANWGTAVVSETDSVLQYFALANYGQTTDTTVNTESGAMLTGVAAYLGPSLSTTSFSSGFSGATQAETTPPSKVGGVSATGFTEGFSAQWSAATDDTAVAGYLIQWKRTATPKWSSKTLPEGITRAAIGNLAADASYQVRVIAFDTSGNLADASDTYTVSTGSAHEYPTEATITGTGTRPPSSGGGGGGGGGCFIDALSR